jgi:D-alanine-D-alanine ligase
VAIVALHGKYGEDGTIQGLLELLGIPYTGSGVLASALAMDKSMAKRVLAAEGIPVAPSVDFACRGGRWDESGVADRVAELGYPVIVKPSRQGSTIGMTKVKAPDELNNAIRLAADYDGLVVVEKFIDGAELTVGVLGNDEPFALPVIEIVPAKGFYDYEAKYTPGATEEIVPARIGDEATARAQELALGAHRCLGCRGMCRVDMILGVDGLHVLEVNTIPGMTPTSLLPRAAAAAGISFSRLLDMLVDFALEEGTDG